MSVSTINPRTTAIWVAVLYIIATAASVMGDVFSRPSLTQDDNLTAIAGNSGVVTGAVFFFFMAIGGCPLVVFPDSRRYLFPPDKLAQGQCGSHSVGRGIEY